MKVMMLNVRGVGCEAGIIVQPYRRLVCVRDEDEFIRMHKIMLLQRVRNHPVYGTLTDSQITTLLKTIRIQLTDTGLSDYPETVEQEAALFQSAALREEKKFDDENRS